MNWIKRSLRGLIYGLPLVFATGCHELGHMGDGLGNIYGDRQQTEIAGEVRSVNTRQREIELRTDDRRTRVVRYDDQTRVVYRDRDYAVTNLEPGDYVALQVQTDSPGNLYTDLVTVRESVQDRGGTVSRGRVERLQGTVEHVDPTRGEFELRDEYGKRVMVTLPYNSRRSDIDRLRSLRRGDRVRIEGQFLNPDRFELEAFV
ncbi:MAG: hypothetical protein ACREQW_25755 [Candidatus Binatia bacterium]